DFAVKFFPPFIVTTGRVEIRPKNRPGFPPLISLTKLTVEPGVTGLFRTPIRVHEVIVEGLQIQVPPKRPREESRDEPDRPKKEIYPFVIDRAVDDGTLLMIIPKDKRKDSLEFDLKRLKLWSAGIESPMTFQALLTNPTPPGEIETNGKFGPW